MPVRKYRKKPVVIDALVFTGDNWGECFGFVGDASTSRNIADKEFRIHTLEGTMIANPGDYIIKGVQGEFYPCKLDIFEATYEEA